MASRFGGGGWSPQDHHLPRTAEARRPFVPTFWTITKGQQPKGHVEQTWFAGTHGNVGGGWADSGLSDQALIWMIARVHVLTGLEFDVQAVKSNTKPNVGGAVEDSTEGIWLLDHYFPHYRVILAPLQCTMAMVVLREDNFAFRLERKS